MVVAFVAGLMIGALVGVLGFIAYMAWEVGT